MKRVFAIMLSILLVSAMLGGCSAERKLRGTWRAEADITSVMQQVLWETWPDSVYQVENFTVTLELTFRKDGTCSIALQEDSMQAALDQLQVQMQQDFVDNLSKQLTVSDKNVSLGDVLKVTGVELDTLVQDFQENFRQAYFPGELREEMNFNGYFSLEDEKLYISDTAEIDEDSFAFQHTLEDGVLTMPMVYGDAPMNEDIPAVIAPLQFQKAK